MNILKNYDSNSDLYLFVAFHHSQEESIEVSQTRLETLMKEVFKNDERYTLINSGERHEDNEIIYRFQKPLMMSEKETSVFFSKLKFVFSMTSEMSPHFTQFNGEPKGV